MDCEAGAGGACRRASLASGRAPGHHHLFAGRRHLRDPAVELPRLSGDPLRHRQPDGWQRRTAQARLELYRKWTDDREDLP